VFKNALISVSDKTGLLEFAKSLVTQGVHITSTGGTAKYLSENGISVTEVATLTQFPEVMDGRVKTLHPKVHMALLGRPDIDSETLAKFDVQIFDLVVVNLYPFEQTVRSGARADQIIEKIDVGGPAMLRAAAKNFKYITVVCNPSDYENVLKSQNDQLNFRQRMAAKVFYHVSSYDSMVAHYLAQGGSLFSAEESYKDFSLGFGQGKSLRYGENSHQGATWFRTKGAVSSLSDAQVLQGKELSYNNILDLDAATQLVQKLDEPAAVVVKHNNPCGVSVSSDISTAIQKAFAADPVSCFGGIVALNRQINADTASALSKVFLECVIAPSIDDEAKIILAKKTNLRVLIWPEIVNAESGFEYKSVAGGILIQSANLSFGEVKQWKFLGEVPNDIILGDLIFAEKVVGSLKSNAIAIVQGGSTLGLGMGQVNRVDAVEHAIGRMRKFHDLAKGAVLASDAFFPFKDSVELAAQAGVKWILQPGGSIKDNEVFEAAKSFGINMVISGRRHFRH
jgi:phosphoribosylaminoimidazolecarboxamide formyltransferase / IMP cyclohydrolase